jgi:hypothetical protein
MVVGSKNIFIFYLLIMNCMLLLIGVQILRTFDILKKNYLKLTWDLMGPKCIYKSGDYQDCRSGNLQIK